MYYNVSTGVWCITVLVQGCGIFVYNHLKNIVNFQAPDVEEQYLAGQYKLIYLHGKGPGADTAGLLPCHWNPDRTLEEQWHCDR